MSADRTKKLLPPERPVYSDEELERFSVDDLYRMKLTVDETMRLRAINESRRNEAARESREWRNTEAVLVADLRAVGLRVQSIWDLVNTTTPYPEAFPILLDHLQRQYPEPVKEGIIRSLSVSALRGQLGSRLIELFKTEQSENLRWVIGNAISVTADEVDLPVIERLLEDASYGRSRSMLAHAVARLKGRAAIPQLLELLEDETVAFECIEVLGKLKATEARAGIESYVNHKNQQLRGQARKALRKLHVAESSSRSSSANRLPTPFADPITPAELEGCVETSMNFDTELVAPFLKRLKSVVEGFGEDEIERVVELIDAMTIDEQRHLDFRIRRGPKALPLRIQVFLDDVDAPDITFWSSKEVVAQISDQFKQFCEEKGI